MGLFFTIYMVLYRVIFHFCSVVFFSFSMDEVIFYTVSSSHSHISTLFLIFLYSVCYIFVVFRIFLLNLLVFFFSANSFNLFYGLFSPIFLTFWFSICDIFFVTDAVYKVFCSKFLAFFSILFISFTIISLVFIIFLVIYLSLFCIF